MGFIASKMGARVIGGLLIVIAIMYILILRGQIETLEAREELYKQNDIVQDAAIQNGANAMELATTQATANIKRIADYETQQASDRAETQRLIGENNDLRATEERAALMAPFERGMAAGVRINDSLQRLATDPSLQDSSVAISDTTDNSPRAESDDSGSGSSDSGNT